MTPTPSPMKGTPSPRKKIKSPKKLKVRGEARRSSRDLRQEHLAKGAFLIEFNAPSVPVNMYRRDDVPAALRPGQLYAGKGKAAAVDKYRTMERKGFHVSRDIGCLIPHDQYSTYQHGATLKGHQRTVAFFAGWLPVQGTQAMRNASGWPVNPQISHLCHRRSCCRIDHLVVEEQWKNAKRNFCGSKGVCDCGNDIKCLRMYSSDNQQVEDPLFCSTVEEVNAVMTNAPPHTVSGDSQRKLIQKRDAKAVQRDNLKKRKRKGAKVALQTQRNKEARGAAEGTPAESEEADDSSSSEEEST